MQLIADMMCCRLGRIWIVRYIVRIRDCRIGLMRLKELGIVRMKDCEENCSVGLDEGL